MCRAHHGNVVPWTSWCFTVAAKREAITRCAPYSIPCRWPTVIAVTVNPVRLRLEGQLDHRDIDVLLEQRLCSHHLCLHLMDRPCPSFGWGRKCNPLFLLFFLLFLLFFLLFFHPLLFLPLNCTQQWPSLFWGTHWGLLLQGLFQSHSVWSHRKERPHLFCWQCWRNKFQLQDHQPP